MATYYGNSHAVSAGTNIARLCRYDSTGGLTIAETTSFTDIPFDTSRIDTGHFSINVGNTEITIDHAMDALISWTVTLQKSAGATRMQGMVRLFLDTGAGFAEVAGNRSFHYHRDTTLNSSTYSGVHELSLSAGDKLKIVAEELQNAAGATDTLDTRADSSSISIWGVLT